MKPVINLCFLIIILLAAISCQKKELELNLVETACKNFKLHSPSYSWISDPSCGNGSMKASLKISFDFDGDNECVHQIQVSPQFYKADNSIIEQVTYSGTLLKTDTLVSIINKTVSFTFDFEFENRADADSLNHVYFKIHTENELGNKSKNFELRLNATCSTVKPGTYTVVKDINITTNTVDVNLKDDATEDGDIISIYLNGMWVLENYTLTNAGTSFTFPVKQGDNHLVLFAVNEGRVGPNTVSLSINGTSINISPDLLKGEAVNIKKF